jgi:D-alanyl-D-alanine dipeptidase
MRIKAIVFSLLAITSSLACANSNGLPSGFVYLEDVDPSIMQDIRYATEHNFIGSVVNGYQAPRCILTLQTAQALHKVQTALRPLNLGLKVYDCYRPQMAVDEFIAWSQDPNNQAMKAEFYPRINKADVFKLGYVAAKSSHSRGSTVDITIVPIPTPQKAAYQSGQPLVACYAPYGVRFRDNSIDMGTGFDCMDVIAHTDNKDINPTAQENRQLLANVMEKYGFKPDADEWWHFTLANEPYPTTYFNFPVR